MTTKRIELKESGVLFNEEEHSYRHYGNVAETAVP